MKISEDHISTKEAVQNLIKYSQTHGKLIQKFNNQFLLTYFDRYTIEELTQKVGRRKIFTRKQFVRELTCFIMHRSDETLFLVINLLTVFDAIVAQIKSEGQISLKEFTSYLCEAIANEQSQNIINQKQMPIEKINPNPNIIRDIDLHPPKIISHPHKEIPKISKSFKKKQKKIDATKPLHIFYFNHQKKEIITLGRLASQISIFDVNLKEVRQIKPLCFKLFDKNMAIMSMAFSQKQQRIGCIIAHTGMAFWDYEDGFQTEKLIRKIIGDKLHYLPLLDEWVTTTQHSLYFWNLKLQQIKFSFGESTANSINDIKQITHLRCLAVSYTMADDHKWIYLYRNEGMKLASKLKLGHVGAQKIHYNRCTQTILLVGKNQLPVYTVDELSFDLSLLKNLIGHETIITAIADLQQGLIVTGDDRGNLRIWDLKTLRCQQVIRVSNSINKIQCIGHNLIFSDSRINVMRIQQLNQKLNLQQLYGIRKLYRIQAPIYEVYIFTSTSCRIYDLTDGRLKQVVEICSNEQEIVAVERSVMDIMISTSRGQFICYSEQFKQKWRMNLSQYHPQEILHIRNDAKNKFFTTVGKEGNIYLWNQKTFQEEGPRKSLQTTEKGYHFEVSLFQLSEKYSFMVTAQKSPDIKIWDYQSFKLCQVIQLQANCTSIKISQNYPLLIISCSNQKVYLYKLSRKENMFSVQFLYLLNLRFPNKDLNSLISQKTGNQRSDEFKSLIAHDIVLNHQLRNHQMFISYGKGNVIAFNITNIINSNFRQTTFFKLAVNIQRPIRQSLQKQINKNQFRRTEKIDQSIFINNQLHTVLWNKKLHSDNITDLQFFQGKYISTLSVDGFYKIVNLIDGQCLCSLSLRHPLPTLWKLQPFQFGQLSQKVHDALIVLSDIINDKQYRFSQDQLAILNIQSFMKKICFQKITIPLKRRPKSIKLLKDQLTPQDLRGIKVSGCEQSLKYLQAYKRVNLINQIHQYQDSGDIQAQKKIISSIEEKETLLKLFSPNYFPNLCNKKLENDSELAKISHIFSKSTHVSISNSLEKMDRFKERDSNMQERIIQFPIEKKENDTLRRKPKLIKQQGRSLSQSISCLKQSMPSIKRQKKDQSIKKFSLQLQNHEPMRSLSNFLKNLNGKLSKEKHKRKNLRKSLNLNNKF